MRRPSPSEPFTIALRVNLIALYFRTAAELDARRRRTNALVSSGVATRQGAFQPRRVPGSARPNGLGGRPLSPCRRVESAVCQRVVEPGPRSPRRAWARPEEAETQYRHAAKGAWRCRRTTQPRPHAHSHDKSMPRPHRLCRPSWAATCPTVHRVLVRVGYRARAFGKRGHRARLCRGGARPGPRTSPARARGLDSDC